MSETDLAVDRLHTHSQTLQFVNKYLLIYIVLFLFDSELRVLFDFSLLVKHQLYRLLALHVFIDFTMMCVYYFFFNVLLFFYLYLCTK